MSYYVDVHTHLTHDQFADDCADVIADAERAGLGAIVVNGLEPKSNRAILAMAAANPIIRAACGIYPTEAVNDILPPDFKMRVERFSVDDEIAFIREQALKGTIAAVGECGLDGHWLGPDTFAAQERVFVALIEVAVEANIPVIVHTRKLERRTLEILSAHNVKKADLHCYCGDAKLGQTKAEAHGWCFSIPANLVRHDGFQRLVSRLPKESILTETDAPYLGPVPNTRNVPSNVVQTVKLISNLRGWTEGETKELVWNNFLRLFDRRN